MGSGAEDQIEITPEMIEAGMDILREESIYIDLPESVAEDLVRRIILCTWRACLYNAWVVALEAGLFSEFPGLNERPAAPDPPRAP